MKFLKGFNKLIEAILLLFIPVIVFYWFLLVVHLDVVKPFIAIFGAILDPMINHIKPFIHYEMQYSDGVIDFNPLILGCIFFLASLVVAGFGKGLDILENAFGKISFNTQEKENKKQRELSKAKYIEELARNKVVYMVLKFKKKETSSAYLFEGEENTEKANLDKFMEELVSYASSFNAKSLNKNDDGEYCFILYNVIEAIDYSFYLHNKVFAAAKDFAVKGAGLSITVGCHCAYSENTAAIDVPVTSKVLSLGGENEIVVSELFKNKYEAMKSETNLVFTSRGVYDVDNGQIEVFQLKCK